MIAEVFIGPRPLGLHINRIDGDKANNSSGNLDYVTQTEKNRHAIRMGLSKPTVANLVLKDWQRCRRLTDEQIEEIRALKGHMNTVQIARLYGVHNSYLSRVQRGFRRRKTSAV